MGEGEGGGKDRKTGIWSEARLRRAETNKHAGAFVPRPVKYRRNAFE